MDRTGESSMIQLFLHTLKQVAIVVAVVLVMVVTAVNDWEKEKQFRGLQEVIEDSKKYSVMRSGGVVEVSERSLVVGDVIILKYGDRIPADGILLRSSELRVDESVSISHKSWEYFIHISPVRA